MLDLTGNSLFKLMSTMYLIVYAYVCVVYTHIQCVHLRIREGVKEWDDVAVTRSSHAPEAVPCYLKDSGEL